jgi:hypothetical protein
VGGKTYMANIAFLIAGIVMLSISISVTVANIRFMMSAKTADGVVVDLKAGGSHPEIRFSTSDGNEITYQQGGFIFAYRVGDPVHVYYSAERPKETASIDALGALWFVPSISLVLGLLFLWIRVSQ